MTDEELIARLREGATWDDDIAAADRIEALVKERDRYRDAFNTNCLVLRGTEERVERLEAAIRELKRCWYQGDLTENDFATALQGDDHE